MKNSVTNTISLLKLLLLKTIVLTIVKNYVFMLVYILYVEGIIFISLRD